MHMADALVSPAVGGAMWAVSAGLAAHSARRLTPDVAERKVPLMGVLGAFVFAAQMINFAIPMTGSSGHLGGGMILAILLGPHAGFLVMFSILAVQALLFADGGLLALGCNVFNLGFWPCFVMYPLVFRPIVGEKPVQGRILAGALSAGILSLQLGALGVVLQTLLSGISELPAGTFALLMQSIHLAIGVVEGAVTAALASFVWKARPEVMAFSAEAHATRSASLKPVLLAFGTAAVVTGGLISWFASVHPDGLEWSMFRTSGKEGLRAPSGGVHSSMAAIQKKTAILPDYHFTKTKSTGGSEPTTDRNSPQGPEKRGGEHRPAARTGTSLSGLVGGTTVLLLAGLVGVSLRFLKLPRK